jgi:hypothetical protein
MKVAQEKRGFDVNEAVLLHRLLDTISLYCAQSVVWWDRGEGERITDDADRTMEQPAPKAPRAPEKPAAKPPDARPSRALPVGIAQTAPNPGGKQ